MTPRRPGQRKRLRTPKTIDAACGCGKRAYPSKAEAVKAARLTMDHLGGELVHPYHCEAGGGWHVGHTRKGRR